MLNRPEALALGAYGRDMGEGVDQRCRITGSYANAEGRPTH